ncbi:MAG: hypothetical protein AAFX65_08480 [Cyanobacteria bacterium J06638_7]
MVLSEPHRQHLLAEVGEQGLEVAIEYGARTADADEVQALGFRYQGWRGGGLLLPFADGFAQLRCDEPPVSRCGDAARYLNLKGAKQQPATFGGGKPAIATEGWKDGLRLHLETGETVQAIPGVTAWKKLALSIWLLIYDADAPLNPAVWGQLIRAGLERPALQLSFFPRELAGKKGGACEFFNAGGHLAMVTRCKPRELLRELPSKWDRDLRVDWHAPAVRQLAVLAVEAGLSRDAVKQLVEGAAKRIGLPVRRAREHIAAARRGLAPFSQPEQGGPVPRNDAPPERQAAQLLYGELGGLVASYGRRFYRYDHVAGYWRFWSDGDAQTAALAVLQRMFHTDEEGLRQTFAYGTAHQMQATVTLLARIAGPGPLSGTPPAVVVLGNGTFNLRTGRLEPHSPKNGATCALDADYITGASCPGPLRRVIETCYPDGAETIIRAEIRWVVDPTIRYGEAFHHLGPTGSGKGLIVAFLQSLVPPTLQSSLTHPADIKDPDKLHQYVAGRQLIVFPDAPARYRDRGHCGMFYELVENKPQTARRLHSSDAEDARPMYSRCILASVAPLQFGDSLDGFQRRVLTLHTLPRSGDPDPTLQSDLICSRQARSEAVSWALSMPPDEVNAVLDKDDPEGLLRQGEAEAAAAGDSVSQWADACLEPHASGHGT